MTAQASIREEDRTFLIAPLIGEGLARVGVSSSMGLVTELDWMCDVPESGGSVMPPALQDVGKSRAVIEPPETSESSDEPVLPRPSSASAVSRYFC